jgi:arylsulfatase A-like enzyme
LVEEEPLPNTLTERFTQRAVDFIESTPEDQAFFYYFAHIMPHVPVVTAPEFVGSSPRGTPYGDSIHEIDHSVGQLLAALQRTNRAQDTLVLYLSDNGGTDGYGAKEAGNNGGLRGWKGSSWEGGIRTPCIARWPEGIAAGQVIHEAITVMDWFPTIAALSGGTLPEVTLDGINLLPLLQEQPWSGHEVILHTNRNKPQAIRKGNWKFREVKNKDKATGEVTVEIGLYDIIRDPGEHFNMAHRYPERVEAMRQEMHATFAAMKADARPATKLPKPAPPTASRQPAPKP